MSRTKSRDLEIYNYLKENKLSLYSIKSLAVTLSISEEDIKKLVSIYKSQGYTPEQCSEISDIELQTVNKYWSKKCRNTNIQKMKRHCLEA